MTNSADPDQKPTDLDLHCLQRQGISGFSRTRVNIYKYMWREKEFAKKSQKRNNSGQYRNYIKQNNYKTVCQYLSYSLKSTPTCSRMTSFLGAGGSIIDRCSKYRCISPSIGIWSNMGSVRYDRSWIRKHFYHKSSCLQCYQTMLRIKIRAQLFKTNDSLKFTSSDTQICWNFLLKKCEMLLQCKSYSHFFSKKYQNIVYWIC